MSVGVLGLLLDRGRILSGRLDGPAAVGTLAGDLVVLDVTLGPSRRNRRHKYMLAQRIIRDGVETKTAPDFGTVPRS